MATTSHGTSRARVMRNPGSDPREDVRKAIERAWPGDVVEMAFDSDKSWFHTVYPKLARALQRIAGVEPVFEREAAGEPLWFDDSDPEEDPPDDHEPSRSYHIFFVCPAGEAFRYETEVESCNGEDGLAMETFSGHGRTGWLLAVSLLARFAVVTLSARETFEGGSSLEPSIESLTETGQQTDRETEFRKLKGEQAFNTLVNLRARICAILDKHRVEVLPETEWRKPVPWLRADEDVFAGSAGEPLRVLDSFFFEGL